MTTTKQPQSLGFEDAFDQVKPDRWPLPEKEHQWTIMESTLRISNRLPKQPVLCPGISNRLKSQPTRSTSAPKSALSGIFVRSAKRRNQVGPYGYGPGTGSRSPQTRTVTKPYPATRNSRMLCTTIF